MKRPGLTLVALLSGGMFLSTAVLLSGQPADGNVKPAFNAPAQPASAASTNSAVQANQAAGKTKVHPPFRKGPEIPDEVSPAKKPQTPRRDRKDALR